MTQNNEPLRTVSMADVEPEKLEWLWPGFLPKGKLVVCDGDPCLGKSLVSVDLAARISRGATFPEQTTRRAPANVLMISSEDHEADTVRPRLDAAGADVSRILMVPLAEAGRVTLSGPELAELLRDLSPALLVIDPLVSFLGRVDAHRDSEVRQVLSKLAGVAQETGTTVLAIRHLNKTSGNKALYRGGGSIGIVGAARAAWIVGRHPQDKALRVLASTKSNLGTPPPSLCYSIEEGENNYPCIEWRGTTSHSADDIVQGDTPTPARAENAAREFLQELLADGPMPAAEVHAMAEKAGISTPTLRRAKVSLGVSSEKSGQPGSSGGWCWSLPTTEDDQGFPEDDHLFVSDHLDRLDHLDTR